MNRRGFFARFAAVVAGLTLAPKLLSAQPLEIIPIDLTWDMLKQPNGIILPPPGDGKCYQINSVTIFFHGLHI